MPSPQATVGDREPRVVHLVHSLEIGGAERVVLDLAQRAVADGLDHRLLVCDHAFRGSSIDLDPGSVPVELIARRPGFDLGFARRIRRWFRAVGAEVVHAHNETPIAYAALAGALPGAPGPALIGTFHNLPTHGGRLARVLARWATARAAAVTAVSAELGERLAREGWSIPPMTVANGVDLERFRPEGPDVGWRRRLGVADDVPLVGMLARFVPVKRQEELLEAARVVWRSGLRPALVYVGQGPERARFEQLLRAGEHVHVLDRLDDVAAWLRALDVFVLCSEHEAAPRALLEAMACARPCVASAVGGVPELADGGRAVELVPPRDPAALARVLEELLRSPRRRAELGRRARERASDYSSERSWREHLALWRRAAGGA